MKPGSSKMAQALADLKRACDALPSTHASKRVADPIYGNTTPPAFAPVPGTLPPLIAGALVDLRHVLRNPPNLANKWPFANPPAVQTAIDTRKRASGRPGVVQPNQVVRLARFVKLGYSVTEAAAKAGLNRSTAQNILAGRLKVCHAPAVSLAGYSFPPMQKRSKCSHPVLNSAKHPSGALNREAIPREHLGSKNTSSASEAESCLPLANNSTESPMP